MAKKITDLDDNSVSLKGNEYIEVVQSSSSRKAQLSEIPLMVDSAFQTWTIVSDGASSWKFNETNTKTPPVIADTPCRLRIFMLDSQLSTDNVGLINLGVLNVPTSWDSHLVEFYLFGSAGENVSFRAGLKSSKLATVGGQNFPVYYSQSVYFRTQSNMIFFKECYNDSFPTMVHELSKAMHIIDSQTGGISLELSQYASVIASNLNVYTNLIFGQKRLMGMTTCAWADSGNGVEQVSGYPFNSWNSMLGMVVLRNQAQDNSYLDIVVPFDPSEIIAAQNLEPVMSGGGAAGNIFFYCIIEPNSYSKGFAIELQNGWSFLDGSTQLDFGTNWGYWAFSLYESGANKKVINHNLQGNNP